MGGKMAWSLAASQPERIQALVLMAPDGFSEAKDIGTKPYEVPSVMGLIKYVLPKYLVRKSIEPAFSDANALNDALVNRYFDMLRAPGVRGAILERSNQTIYTNPVPRLKAIKAPTLLIWGEQDQMIPSTNAQSYANVLSNSTTVLVPEARPPVAGRTARKRAGGRDAISRGSSLEVNSKILNSTLPWV